MPLEHIVILVLALGWGYPLGRKALALDTAPLVHVLAISFGLGFSLLFVLGLLLAMCGLLGGLFAACVIALPPLCFLAWHSRELAAAWKRPDPIRYAALLYLGGMLVVFQFSDNAAHFPGSLAFGFLGDHVEYVNMAWHLFTTGELATNYFVLDFLAAPADIAQAAQQGDYVHHLPYRLPFLPIVLAALYCLFPPDGMLSPLLQASLQLFGVMAPLLLCSVAAGATQQRRNMRCCVFIVAILAFFLYPWTMVLQRFGYIEAVSIYYFLLSLFFIRKLTVGCSVPALCSYLLATLGLLLTKGEGAALFVGLCLTAALLVFMNPAQGWNKRFALLFAMTLLPMLLLYAGMPRTGGSLGSSLLFNYASVDRQSNTLRFGKDILRRYFDYRDTTVVTAGDDVYTHLRNTLEIGDLDKLSRGKYIISFILGTQASPMFVSQEIKFASTPSWNALYNYLLYSLGLAANANTYILAATAVALVLPESAVTAIAYAMALLLLPMLNPATPFMLRFNMLYFPIFGFLTAGILAVLPQKYVEGSNSSVLPLACLAVAGLVLFHGVTERDRISPAIDQRYMLVAGDVIQGSVPAGAVVASNIPQYTATLGERPSVGHSALLFFLQPIHETFQPEYLLLHGRQRFLGHESQVQLYHRFKDSYPLNQYTPVVESEKPEYLLLKRVGAE